MSCWKAFGWSACESTAVAETAFHAGPRCPGAGAQPRSQRLPLRTGGFTQVLYALRMIIYHSARRVDAVNCMDIIQATRYVRRSSTSVYVHTLGDIYYAASSSAPSVVRYFWSSDACVRVV